MSARGEASGVLACGGADPGPTTGLVLAAWNPVTCELLQAIALECTAGQAPGLLSLLLNAWQYGRQVRAAGIEGFVSRHRSQQLRGVQAAAMHREIAALEGVFARCAVSVSVRPAADVKPWASDRRLKAAGLAEHTSKFADAADAGRHALFTAVQNLGLPDPLSAMWQQARKTALLHELTEG